jgi:DNA-binding NtrC family response regulator
VSSDETTSSHATKSLVFDTTSQRGCVVRVLDGDDAGRAVEVQEGGLLVGSRAEVDLRLHDATVSGRHLKILPTEDGLLVTDLGSKNGTFYLDTRLERAVLQIGAVVRVGQTRLLLASRQPVGGPGYSARTSYGALVGGAPATRRLYAALEQLEPLDYTALILGETGVGKEVVANEIHNHSARHQGPFEVCDCASLNPSLVESELFGHVRGAFTGANSNYTGVFERADRGTIFLDEIGELPMDLQPKLLRVLESRTVRRVGSGGRKPVDVRVIAATNRDLADRVKSGDFREDLFYRLNLVTLEIPPLRQRREDIPWLVRHFLDQLGHGNVELSSNTLELFTTGYDWPGNVRELRHAVARFQGLGALPREIEAGIGDQQAETEIGFDPDGTFQEEKRRIISAFERDYLSAKLAASANNISRAARESNMERNQFKRLLKKHGLLS